MVWKCFCSQLASSSMNLGSLVARVGSNKVFFSVLCTQRVWADESNKWPGDARCGTCTMWQQGKNTAQQESSLCSAEAINQQTIAREPCSFPNASPNRYLPRSPPEDILAGTDRLACRGICDVQNRKTQQQNCDRCKAGAVEQVSAQKHMKNRKSQKFDKKYKKNLLRPHIFTVKSRIFCYNFEFSQSCPCKSSHELYGTL